MAEACRHPNCERHGKSPVVGIGCDGESSFPAVSQPLTASGGLAGVPGTPPGPGEAPGGAEGVGHTERLARALKECWLAGEQLNMALPLGERIDWLAFARAVEKRLTAQVSAPVDTEWEDRKSRGFDCPVCRGTGRTQHADMPDGSVRAQGCLACAGSGMSAAVTWETLSASVLTADREGPEQGHTFRLEAHSRGSYGLMEDGDPAPHDHRDAEWMGEPPLTLEVRAWSLRAALVKAARIALPEWRREGKRLADG